jgi:hypothetical protein
MFLWLSSKPREVRKWDYLARKRRILRRILQHSNTPATIGDILDMLETWEATLIKGKHAVSWTIEFGRETPKDGRWSLMTVHSEAEAVRQAKEYLDIGFVVNAIKRPDGSIAHDQDQLSALYHGFDDLALKLAEKRMPRN